MAITRMKKVFVFAHEKNMVAVLERLQRIGVLEIEAAMGDVLSLEKAVEKRAAVDSGLEGRLKRGLSFISDLKLHYYGVLSRNMIQYKELDSILKELFKHNIKVIVLKGAALATTLYGNIGLRPFSDIDILVKKEDLGIVQKKIIELGYIVDPQLKSPIKKGLPVERYYMKYHPHLPPFYKRTEHSNFERRGGIFLEVHWALTAEMLPFNIDIKNVWERANESEIAENNVLVMSNEDSLIHMCVHIARHRFSAKLREYTDISELCLSGIDWDYVARNVMENNIKNPVYWSLYLTKLILNADISEDFLERIKPGHLRTSIFNSIIDIKAVIRSDTEKRKASGLIIELITIDSGVDMIRSFFRRLFPPVEWMALRYSVSSSKKIYFYYPIRWGYLAFKAVKFPFALLSNKGAE